MWSTGVEMTENIIQFKPIGWVKSIVTEPVDVNWGHIVSEIHLSESLSPGLHGISQFSHVLVIFMMHRSTFDPTTDLVRRPQGRQNMPKIGIFAQRAKHRPNPIGISAVELVEIRQNVLRVKGLDAINGTPVLDLKPYFPVFDRVEEAVVPEWVDRLMQNYF